MFSIAQPVSGGKSFADCNTFGKSFERLALERFLQDPPPSIWDSICERDDLHFQHAWEAYGDVLALQYIQAHRPDLHGELAPVNVACPWDFRVYAPGWELKAEAKACRTSRLFVEENYRDRPSGIRNTEAALWVFGTVTGNAFGLWLPQLLELTAHLPRCRAGDGKRSVGSWLDVSTVAASSCWSWSFNPSALWGVN